MTFSRSAAVNVTPLLARVVLALLFIPAGYSKIFVTKNFEGEQAATLRALGVEGSAPIGAPATDPGAQARSGLMTTPASAMLLTSLGAAQDEGGGGGLEEAARDAAEDVAEAAGDAAEAVEEAVTPARLDLTGVSRDPMSARGLYSIALMLEANGLPQPVIGAWLAGVTEFVGGILLVLGLFTRVWGFGLAIAMGMAFYLTTWQNHGGADFFGNLMGFLPEGNYLAFNTLGAQLALGVLALGVTFSGAGMLSLDHLLFGRKRNKAVVVDDDFND